LKVFLIIPILLFGFFTMTSFAKNAWSAFVGWRYISYTEGANTVALYIEPMFNLPDIVYLPSLPVWDRQCPGWAKGKREIIIARLKSIHWKRDFVWEESGGNGFVKITPMPGSIESTPGGKKFEADGLFKPDSPLTKEQAKQVWYAAVKAFTEQVKGKVRIFADMPPNPGSVFAEIELPILKGKKDVDLIFKRPDERP